MVVFGGKEGGLILDPPIAIPTTLPKEIGGNKILSFGGWNESLSTFMVSLERQLLTHQFHWCRSGSSDIYVMLWFGRGGLPFHAYYSLMILFPWVLRNHLLLLYMVVAPMYPTSYPQYGAANSEIGGVGTELHNCDIRAPNIWSYLSDGVGAQYGCHNLSFRHT